MLALVTGQIEDSLRQKLEFVLAENRVYRALLDRVPVTVSTHARYTVARICVPTGWMRWWRLFLDQWLPKRKAGRPVMEVVDSA